MARKTLLAAGIWALLSLGSCSHPEGGAPASIPSVVPAAAVHGDSGHFKGTVVSADLSQPIEEGKNVLWCASLQLAWNELMDVSGGPIEMKDAPPVVAVLNRKTPDRNDLDGNAVVAVAGVVGDGVLQSIRKQLARRFPGGPAPELLPPDGSLPNHAVVAYAYMYRALPFQHRFQRETGMRFGPVSGGEDSNDYRPRVDFFGLNQYVPDHGELDNEANQVRVIWHRYIERGESVPPDEEFVVELLTSIRDDRLFLAKVEPNRSLGETVNRVLKLAADPFTVDRKEAAEAQRALGVLCEDGNSSYAGEIARLGQKAGRRCCLLFGETLEVPVIDFDVVKSYDVLCGRSISSRNQRLDGLPIMEAKQQIRFRLDEKGAVLTSEFSSVMLGTGPRSYSFDGPFLVMLIHKGSTMPYFALWVGNAELLAASPKKDTEPSE